MMEAFRLRYALHSTFLFEILFCCRSPFIKELFFLSRLPRRRKISKGQKLFIRKTRKLWPRSAVASVDTRLAVRSIQPLNHPRSAPLLLASNSIMLSIYFHIFLVRFTSLASFGRRGAGWNSWMAEVNASFATKLFVFIRTSQ